MRRASNEGAIIEPSKGGKDDECLNVEIQRKYGKLSR